MDSGRQRQSGEEDGRTTLARSFPLLLLVMAVSVFVAMSSNGLRLLLPAIDLDGGGLWAIRAAGTAAAVAGLAGLLVQRRRLRTERHHRPDPSVVALRTAATIMGVVTLLALLNAPSASEDRAIGAIDFGLVGEAVEGEDGSGGQVLPARTRGGDPMIMAGEARRGRARTPTGPRDEPSTLVERVARVLSVALLLVVVLVGLLALARRLAGRRKRPAEEATLVPAEAQSGLEASLVAVRADRSNPRQLITAAYHRLLAALATAGAGRQPQEAPHEHLHRTLAPLGVHPESLHRLAELYVLAQFSERPVTEEHRATAADALLASLADLRSMHGPAGAEASEPIPQEASR